MLTTIFPSRFFYIFTPFRVFLVACIAHHYEAIIFLLFPYPYLLINRNRPRGDACDTSNSHALYLLGCCSCLLHLSTDDYENQTRNMICFIWTIVATILAHVVAHYHVTQHVFSFHISILFPMQLLSWSSL